MASSAAWGAWAGLGEGIIEQAERVSERKDYAQKSRLDTLREEALIKLRTKGQLAVTEASTEAAALRSAATSQAAGERGQATIEAADRRQAISTASQAAQSMADRASREKIAADKLAAQQATVGAKAKEWTVSRGSSMQTGETEIHLFNDRGEAFKKEGSTLWLAGLSGTQAAMKKELLKPGAMDALNAVADRNMQGKDKEAQREYLSGWSERYGFIPAKYLSVFE